MAYARPISSQARPRDSQQTHSVSVHRNGAALVYFRWRGRADDTAAATSQRAAERRHEAALQELTSRLNAEQVAAVKTAQEAFSQRNEDGLPPLRHGARVDDPQCAHAQETSTTLRDYNRQHGPQARVGLMIVR